MSESNIDTISSWQLGCSLVTLNIIALLVSEIGGVGSFAILWIKVLSAASYFCKKSSRSPTPISLEGQVCGACFLPQVTLSVFDYLIWSNGVLLAFPIQMRKMRSGLVPVNSVQFIKIKIIRSSCPKPDQLIAFITKVFIKSQKRIRDPPLPFLSNSQPQQLVMTR